MTPSRRPALIAAAIAVALSVGLVAALVVDEPARRSDTLGSATPTAVPVEPVPSETTAATASPTATPTAIAVPSRAAPRPTTTGLAAPRRSTAAPERAPDDGTGYGAAPGVVTHRFDASRRTYSASRQGISLTATFSTVRVAAGTPVTVTVTGSKDAPTCCSLHVLYGDGQSDTSQHTSCPQPRDTSRRATFEHTWNKAGWWVLQLQANESGCGGGDAYALMRVTVEVTAGTSVSNGPKQPTVRVDRSEPPRPGDDSYASYFGTAHDDDGHLTKLVLDYGDGTPPRTFPGDPHECRNGPGGQPGPSDADLPYSPPHSHHYAEPGDYVVTLTAYSAGCDGKAVQTASASFTYVSS